jgi:hypothetical protein
MNPDSDFEELNQHSAFVESAVSAMPTAKSAAQCNQACTNASAQQYSCCFKPMGH